MVDKDVKFERLMEYEDDENPMIVMMDIGFTHFDFGLGRGGTLDGGTSRAEL